MPKKIERALLEAYSRGELTRREISEQSGHTIGFGGLLMQLHEHSLQLPRVKSDPQSPGVQLIKRLAQRGAHA